MNDVKERSTPRKRREARCDDGGGRRDRTDDLLLAKQALSQLSYAPRLSFRSARSRFVWPARTGCYPKEEPIARKVVGQGGFEPPTSRLSSARSNQLSY
jgi:hypothetical protein